MNQSESTCQNSGRRVGRKPQKRSALQREEMALKAADPKWREKFRSLTNLQGPVPDPMKYPNLKSRCWQWMGVIEPTGYGMMFGQLWGCKAHRFSYAVHNGIISEGMYVLHKCDHRSCVNPDHLFEGTYKDNSMDMFRKGRDNRPKGERNHKAKLNRDQVVQIRDRHSNGENRFRLSREFNVNWSTVDRIVKREIWTHIPTLQPA
jgi:hypothetical protein